MCVRACVRLCVCVCVCVIGIGLASFQWVEFWSLVLGCLWAETLNFLVKGHHTHLYKLYQSPLPPRWLRRNTLHKAHTMTKLTPCLASTTSLCIFSCLSSIWSARQYRWCTIMCPSVSIDYNVQCTKHHPIQWEAQVDCIHCLGSGNKQGTSQHNGTWPVYYHSYVANLQQIKQKKLPILLS